MKYARAKRAKILFSIVIYENLWGFRRRRVCLSSLLILLLIIITILIFLGFFYKRPFY